MPPTEKPKYSTPALDKGLDILELLSKQQKPLSMSEIAEQLGKTRSQIFRMMHTLEERDFIYRRHRGSDHFMLTVKLFEMGLNHPPHRLIQEVALPLMRRLSEDIEQPCYLSVAYYEFVLAIASVDSSGYLGLYVRPGYREPLIPSAAGHVMFAFLHEDVQQVWIDSFRDYEHSDLDIDAYRAKALQIREAGYEVRPNCEFEGVVDIVAPIMDTIGNRAQASAVIPFVSRKTGSLSVNEVRDALVATTEEISQQLRVSTSGDLE